MQDSSDAAFFPARSTGMTSLIDTVRTIKAPRVYYSVSLGIVLLWAALAISALHQPRKDAERSQSISAPRIYGNEVDSRAYGPGGLKLRPSEFIQKQEIADSPVLASNDAPDAAEGRRIIRSASMDMIVQHPAEAADQIIALAEKLGGYLVSADGAGENAMLTTVTVRVPAAHFDEARAAIRQLGLRVENEKFTAQDVTQQYVDQGATIRNLQAQEIQYLEILKQANNVPNLMAVSEKLSEVRGKIERQQAEFNSLSHQAETVAIAISLRTEHQQQVFGLDWRPLYELKLAASNGLESLANYATTMMTILFYLPAVLLWVGTIVITAILGWRFVQWVRKRLLGLACAQSPIQG
jgi:hypothetical protein